jgi:hypothetical protein
VVLIVALPRLVQDQHFVANRAAPSDLVDLTERQLALNFCNAALHDDMVTFVELDAAFGWRAVPHAAY